MHGFELMACVAMRLAGKKWALDLYDWHARRVLLQAQTDKHGFALLVVRVHGGGFSPKVPYQLQCAPPTPLGRRRRMGAPRN